MSTAPDPRDSERERGSASVETVVILPLIVMLLFLMVGAVRLVHARTQIDQAADQAAIAAADAAGSSAQTAARDAAAAVLGSSADCRDPAVAIAADTDAATASFVTVTVSCAVPLSDLVIAGFPGHRTENARASIPRSLYAVHGQAS